MFYWKKLVDNYKTRMGMMSEDIVQTEVSAPIVVDQPKAPQVKQYLMMVDELNVAIIGKICTGIQFVQVEGINIKGTDSHLALVTPMAKPVVPVPIQESETSKVD